MACIYYIRHKETGRMYIGQTVQTLEQRLKQHLVGTTEMDKALQSIGLNNFEYGIIEQCTSEELDDKEIYYIAKYDTYYNGYNNQLGGRRTGQNKYDNIIELLRQDYINGMSMVDLNIKYKISSNAIRYFVKGLEQKANINNNTNISKIVIGYTKEWKRVGVFESIKSALSFVNNQRQLENKTPVDERNFYRTVKTACMKNGIASGYRWQYAEDVFYNGMQFNSSIDKQNYIMGLNCECRDNIWYTTRNENKSVTKNQQTVIRKNGNQKIDEDAIVQLCGDMTEKQLAKYFDCTVGAVRGFLRLRGLHAKYCNKSEVYEDRTNIGYCIQCNKHEIFKDNLCNSCYNVKILDKTPKPSREQLMIDLDTMKIKSIAMKYERSLSTIKYWIKQYGLDAYVVSDSARLVKCIEVNKVFKSLKDAAYALCGEYNHNIESSISKAAKSGKTYKGYHWEFIEKQ